MPFGSRASYANKRNEQTMRTNLKQSGDFPDSGPTSTEWLHKKQMLIQRGNEFNIARSHRKAQEDLLTARLNEEKQISDLTRARRPQLIGTAARARGAQRVAEQVYNVMK